jgi:hypothetical protein
MNGETAHKVQCRLGHLEFSAEGREEIVHEEYAGFLRAASALDLRAPQAVPETRDGRDHDEDNPSRSTPSATANPDRHGVQDGPGHASNMIDVFAKDEKTGVISLRALPRTQSPETDALLLLLLGHLIIDKRRSVRAPLLAKGARQSGMKMDDRVTTFLEPHRALVTRGGPTHGSMYTLTNPGIAHAERLLSDILA